MATYLFPLSEVHIRSYQDVECLVDVAVQNQHGTTDIVTFDPMLLPWHLRNEFLVQLFQWARDEGVLPLSSHGRWNEQHSDSKTMTLLPLYETWLDESSQESNSLE